jgi:hypothetical protein
MESERASAKDLLLEIADLPLGQLAEQLTVRFEQNLVAIECAP